MKKILLTFMAAIGLAASASAQLAEGSVFPYPGGASGQLTGVNTPFVGQRFNLDSLSNAGYTIFIDISATWCPPCWAYHNSKQLDTLWNLHGPTGMSGVSASTTNDVFVLFVQGEATSHMAELTGNTAAGAIIYTTTELPYAQVTQGDWTAGTPFPMIDDTTSTDANYGTGNIDSHWSIAFFPTVYMICRDHLVHNLTQPSYTAAYAAAQATCPTTPPATGSSVDAKASAYAGAGYFVCNANPSVTFQNYSTTTAITSATITVSDGLGTTVATVPWTGSLAPYAVTTVPVPSFAGTSFTGYSYSVTVTGDINTANDGSAANVFKVYGAANAGAVPFTDNLMGTISNKYSFPSDGSIGLPNPAWGGCPNPAGATTNKYLLFDYYDFSAGTGIFDLVVGNFNTTGVTGLTLQFDEAYARYDVSGTYDDIMNVVVSNDCGTTWNTAWTASGTALATAATTTSGFVPASAADWAHRTVSIPTAEEGTNMMLKFTGTSKYGQYAWVTNLNLSHNPLSVAQVASADFISVTPNPARDVANVNITINEATAVTVEMYDAVGRVVNTVSRNLTAGDQKIELSTSNLATGMYIVKITAGDVVTTKQISVIK